MHYWNRDNFEGLKSVGDKYSSIDRYELFGKYCQLKEQGLKKLAMKAIREFVAVVREKPFSDQREIAEELASLGFYNQNIHQLLAHPLMECLKHVLEHWTNDEPNNPTPHKWLGYLSCNLASYERALELDPKDEVCITRIALAHLNDVDYQTHHLSESFFIGKRLDANASLTKATALIKTLSSEDLRAKMESEIYYYENILICWDEFSKLGTKEPFPSWCKSKGESFNFWSIHYYKH